jgi:hydroxymethylbilane synthase
VTPPSIRIATRGSALALRQAELVTAALARAGCLLPVEVVVVRTTGDRASIGDAAAGTVGAFTHEVDRAVLDGRADVAVHSLKDLPTEPVPGLVLGAVPLRDDPADVLCARLNLTIDALPAGAVIGTGGPRRRALVLRRRPDVVVEPIRGNVDSRLRQLREQAHFDAIVLASAGLRRLGRAAEISQRFDPWEWLPAPGQGAMAITRREGDDRVAATVALVDDPASHAAVRAERAFLAEVDAGCRAPVGALAEWRDGRVRLRAMFASADGSSVRVEELDGDAGNEVALGRRLAERMLARGGREMLERARADSSGASHE